MSVGIFLIIYQCVWLLALPFLRLYLFFKAKRRPLYSQGLNQRFGFYQSHQTADICVHAVSVGEVVAAAPIIETCLANQLKVLITCMTPTGLSQAKRLFGERVAYQYLPYDFSFAINRFIHDRQFKCLLIMETELWPGLLSACHRHKIPCILGNARISNRSYGRYLKTKWFWRHLLNYFTSIGVQSELDRTRFLSLGANSDKLFLMGNLKFNYLPVNQELLHFWQDFKNARPKRLIWVCGSTHEGEEFYLLNAFKTLQIDLPELLLILVPRHPERFDTVAQLIVDSGFNCRRLSQQNTSSAKEEVVLLDKMGELSASYAAADIALVGGSLVPIGGHNVLEPLIFKVPVVCGPYMHNQQDLLRILKMNDVLVISDTSTLVDDIKKLLIDKALRHTFGEKGYAVMQENQGARDLLWQRLKEIFA
jgi:3-deoxy-D-manno-octulosonic-acid transferase